jgi:hypothetical protein
VLEFSTDRGGSWQDAGSLISSGGYTHFVSGLTSNPLAGRNAWCGSQPSFSQVTVNLISLKGRR